MGNKTGKSSIADDWIGVGTVIGAIAFVYTREPIWIALCVAIGAVLDW